MSGRNGHTVSIRKIEVIVSYQHTKKGLDPEQDTLRIEAVLFLSWFCGVALPELPDGG